VDLNELTGDEFPNVQLIDFNHPERNQFIAINQFRIDTPGRVKDCIIPDIVLFVNGIPLAVIECKDANQIQANPMHEAFKQLMRYSDQREETRLSGLKEGDPVLFYPNQVLIRTCGDQADFGSITATDEEYFFPWRDIWPERYKNYQPPLGKEREQEILIQGMLPPETFLDIIRQLHAFYGCWQNQSQDRKSLPAVPGHVKDHPPPANRADTIGALRRYMAHARLWKKPYHGLCDQENSCLR
jgi:type I restriction enzyme, R subunit